MKLFILLVVFSMPIVAQTGDTKPTLAETVEWLETNVSAKAAYTGKLRTTDVQRSVTSTSIAKCVVEIVESRQNTTGTVRIAEQTKTIIPASALSLDSISVKAIESNLVPSPYVLSLGTDGPKRIELRDVQPRGAGNLRMVGEAKLWFQKKDDAERVSNAFRRLIQLCKAQTDARKEPF